MNGPEVIGDEQFLAKLSGNVADIPEGIEQKSITTDAEGNIIGDTSHIDPHFLAQLQTPEAQAQIREMHQAWQKGGARLPRKNRYPEEPPKEPRYINNGTQRRVATVRPKGMSKSESKAFRQACRQERHKLRKAAIKLQRSIHNGN